MKYIDQNNLSMNNTCVAFGDFDGVHLGHKAIADKVIELSKGEMTSVVVCFDYAEELLEGKQVLSTKLEKQNLMSDIGPEVMVSYKIDELNQGIAIEEFVKDVLVGKLGAKVIVTGKEDKNVETLRKYAAEYGYELVECDTVKVDGEAVTSEAIQHEVVEGTFARAFKFLGHPYLIMGEVMHGKALGRTVGMPTANIGFKTYKQLPAYGVYGSLSEIDGKSVKGLTNIGKRPSVDNYAYATVESFLLDFSGDLYGKIISLEIYVFIRGVIKFNGLDEVKAQVDKDAASIREYLDKL